MSSGIFSPYGPTKNDAPARGKSVPPLEKSARFRRGSRRLPLIARIALGMLFSHATPWTSTALAGTEKDVLTTATDLTAGASYVGGGTPGTTWDVTFTNSA